VKRDSLSTPDASLAVRVSGQRALAYLDRRLEGFQRWLDRISRPLFLLGTIGLTLGLSLLFFAPRLWVLMTPMTGTYEWDRASTFLAQSDKILSHPAKADFPPEGSAAQEPRSFSLVQVAPRDDALAMRWRLLPPLVAHVLGFRGFWPLLIPWLGLVAMLAYFALAAERLLGNRSSAALLTVLLGTSGPVLCVTMMHGLNDGWCVLGLLLVAFAGSPALAIAACVWAPWVDERFMLGLPLALFVRVLVAPAGASGRVRDEAGIAAAACIYPLTRLVLSVAWHDQGSVDFIHNALALAPYYLPYAHFGWWMGFRAGWLLLLLFFWYVDTVHGRRSTLWGLLWLGLGWGAVTLLAADLTRSTNLLVPVFFAGGWAATRAFGSRTTNRLLVILLVINLATPWEMVTYNKSLLLHGLPYELIQLYRNWR
jgi:hypothetical protein